MKKARMFSGIILSVLAILIIQVVSKSSIVASKFFGTEKAMFAGEGKGGDTGGLKT